MLVLPGEQPMLIAMAMVSAITIRAEDQQFVKTGNLQILTAMQQETDKVQETKGISWMPTKMAFVTTGKQLENSFNFWNSVYWISQLKRLVCPICIEVLAKNN